MHYLQKTKNLGIFFVIKLKQLKKISFRIVFHLRTFLDYLQPLCNMKKIKISRVLSCTDLNLLKTKKSLGHTRALNTKFLRTFLCFLVHFVHSLYIFARIGQIFIRLCFYVDYKIWTRKDLCTTKIGTFQKEIILWITLLFPGRFFFREIFSA